MTTVQCVAAVAITIVSLSMMMAHVIWPLKIALDNGTLILFGVAALPWLTLFWKKIKIWNVEADSGGERLDERKAKAKEVSNFGPSLAENLHTIMSEHVVNKLASTSGSHEIRKYLHEQVVRIEDNIKRKSCISVDLRALREESGVQTYPVAALSDVGELVDVVFFALNGVVVRMLMVRIGFYVTKQMEGWSKACEYWQGFPLELPPLIIVV